MILVRNIATAIQNPLPLPIFYAPVTFVRCRPPLLHLSRRYLDIAVNCQPATHIDRIISNYLIIEIHRQSIWLSGYNVGLGIKGCDRSSLP